MLRSVLHALGIALQFMSGLASHQLAAAAAAPQMPTALRQPMRLLTTNLLSSILRFCSHSFPPQHRAPALAAPRSLIIIRHMLSVAGHLAHVVTSPWPQMRSVSHLSVCLHLAAALERLLPARKAVQWS